MYVLTGRKNLCLPEKPEQTRKSKINPHRSSRIAAMASAQAVKMGIGSCYASQMQLRRVRNAAKARSDGTRAASLALCHFILRLGSSEPTTNLKWLGSPSSTPVAYGHGKLQHAHTYLLLASWAMKQLWRSAGLCPSTDQQSN